MKEGNVEYIDADSGRTPSDNEKGTALGPKASYGDLPADPDAGRSEAEKLQIVSLDEKAVLCGPKCRIAKGWNRTRG